VVTTQIKAQTFAMHLYESVLFMYRWLKIYKTNGIIFHMVNNQFIKWKSCT